MAESGTVVPDTDGSQPTATTGEDRAENAVDAKDSELRQRRQEAAVLPDAAPAEPWKGKETVNEDNVDEIIWECNICLDTASHPVVTMCGHL
ncbi:hypothetical protein HDU91_007503, partial [Kappamyces sp. JEL0680]